jgi:hypothetical protein
MTDPEPADTPSFSNYREMCDWVAARLLDGSMWAGWDADGRFAYGDNASPAGDTVTVWSDDGEDAGFMLGVLAGSVASHLMARTATAIRMENTERDGGNRAQRRARERNDRNRGLWTPPRV